MGLFSPSPRQTVYSTATGEPVRTIRTKPVRSGDWEGRPAFNVRDLRPGETAGGWSSYIGDTRNAALARKAEEFLRWGLASVNRRRSVRATNRSLNLAQNAAALERHNRELVWQVVAALPQGNPMLGPVLIRVQREPHSRASLATSSRCQFESCGSQVAPFGVQSGMKVRYLCLRHFVEGLLRIEDVQARAFADQLHGAIREVLDGTRSFSSSPSRRAVRGGEKK